MGLRRGHRAKPIEWAAERIIQLVSFAAILMIFLIFVFIGREALPIILGNFNAAPVGEVLDPARMSSLTDPQLQKYLDLTPEQFSSMDRETLKTLMELKVETAQSTSDSKDAKISPTDWRHILMPRQWEGYGRPEYIWQPVSDIPKFNIVPLILGSLKVTIVSIIVALPLSLGAAIYVSQLARPRTREIVKPVIELLAGIPSVVLGFFALMVMASALQSVFGHHSRLNGLVAGIALGFSAIPVIFSIAEDALTSVPRSYTQAALALGASPWKAAAQIVLPAAMPGIFAAIALGFGRAIGETMIVLMASGNASIVSASLLDSTRTITATVAAELGEVVFGGPHYRMLFLIGVMLLTVTFLTNLAGDIIMHRLKARIEGRK
jgi:phosphate transport system permease protein